MPEPGPLTGPSAKRDGSVLPGLILFVCVLGVYLLTLTEYHLQDAVEFSTVVERGEPRDLFHPLHLIYNAAGFILHRAGAAALGEDLSALLVLQIVNAVAGAASVVICFAFLRRHTRDLAASLIGALLVAFSYGYWYFSTEAETYVITILLLTVSLWQAVELRDKPTARRAVLLGVFHGLAILFHIMSGLFVVVGLVAVLWAKGSRGRRLRALACYAASGAVLTLGAYVAAAVLVHDCRSLGDIRDWMFRLYGSGLVSPLTARTLLPRMAIGLGRSFLGGCYALAIPPVRDAVTSLFPGRAVHEDIYLVRNMPLGQVIFAAVATVAALVSGAALAARGIRARRTIADSHATPALLLGVWLAAYFLFFMWYSPENVEFWPFLTVPLWGLAVLVVAAARRRTAGWVLVAAVFSANLFGSVLPACDVSNNWMMLRVRRYEDVARDRSAVVAIVVEGSLTQFYMDSFFSGRTISVSREFSGCGGDVERGFDAVHATIDQAFRDGLRVYVSSWLFEAMTTQPLRRDYGLTPETLRERILSPYRLGPEVWFGRGNECVTELLLE